MISAFQSDIIHQSVMELIHSEDREEFKRQLTWNAMLPQEKSNIPLHEVMLPGENSRGGNAMVRSSVDILRCPIKTTQR